MEWSLQIATAKTMSPQASIAAFGIGKRSVGQGNGQRNSGLHNAEIAPLLALALRVIPRPPLSRDLCTFLQAQKVLKPRLNEVKEW